MLSVTPAPEECIDQVVILTVQNVMTAQKDSIKMMKVRPCAYLAHLDCIKIGRDNMNASNAPLVGKLLTWNSQIVCNVLLAKQLKVRGPPCVEIVLRVNTVSMLESAWPVLLDSFDNTKTM